MKPPETNNRATKRKILIVVENLSVPFDRRVWRECHALRETGYDVSVISPMGIGADSQWRETIDGISIYRYPILQANGSFVSYVLEYSIALIMSLLLMVVVLLRKGYDVVQICNPPDLLFLPALPFKLLGKKIIFDQHDLSPEIYRIQKGKDEQDQVVRALLFMEKMTYFFSDVVMVVNESCRKIAIARGSKIDQEVFVVRNGPSVQNIRAAQANPALKHGMKHLLTYVGMMGPQEGIDILLRAIRNLVVVHGRGDFHVRIVGGGTVLDQMKQYAAELGISHLITFTGNVSYEQVMEGIATADLCLCPDPKTPLSDKCSLVKSIEYMSLGRAFVAFDLEEVRDSAADAGMYARPNDEGDFAAKIHHLLDNDELRTAMGNAGRERVLQRFIWERSKDSLAAAYDKAFEKHDKAFEKKAGTVGQATK